MLPCDIRGAAIARGFSTSGLHDPCTISLKACVILENEEGRLPFLNWIPHFLLDGEVKTAAIIGQSLIMGEIMSQHRYWTDYHLDYRASQMRILADWIQAGHSGSIVGMEGAGKSNLLGFLANRPDALKQYLPETSKALVIRLDLNCLPVADMVTVYRLLLRSFRNAKDKLSETQATEIEQIFAEQLDQQDPFVVQTALFDWLDSVLDEDVRVAIVMDRFDHFMKRATRETTDSLRSIRDAFKGRLCFLAGMRQPIRHLRTPLRLGALQDVLGPRICWVGPMEDCDARRMVAEEMSLAQPPLKEEEVAAIIELAGVLPLLAQSGMPLVARFRTQ